MQQLIEKCKQITKNLRSKYYKYGNVQNDCDCVPFGGSIRESIGPFPEFIMKGRFCRRSLIGYCTPCFYSRLPEHDISDNDFDRGYLSQVDYILENFDDLVVKNQVGKVAFEGESQKPIYGMVCTPTGSYFDEKEYPLQIRKNNLRKIYQKSIEKNCIIALHIETHAEDVIEYIKNPDEEELDLLTKLNARILLGFESVNDVSRNLIYGKHLEIIDFEKAVHLLKTNGFPVGAFVFAGLFGLTDDETIKDVETSLEYLKKIDVSPVLMFANTQKYTIPDVLMQGGRYKLLDPRTVLRIVEILVEIMGCNMANRIDPWFIADPKGGPPDPNLHIFNSPKSTACSSCCEAIYNAIEQLRITKNVAQFKKSCSVVNGCHCKHDYTKLLQADKAEQAVDIKRRIEEHLQFVEVNIQAYTLIENPWLVKAELLCYGLKLSDAQFEIALKYNPYIKEKGFIHAVHIKYQNILINVCVAEKYCQASPYEVNLANDGKWRLLKDGIDIGSFEFLLMPQWVSKEVDGYVVGELIRPHADKCLSLWPSTICHYVQQGLGCKFCCLTNYSEARIWSIETVVKGLELALKENPNYEINLSGGTCGNPDNAIDYLAEICQTIKKKFKTVHISVECAPPTSIKKLFQLYQSGATALVMNLEIYNNAIRRNICPGKSSISREYYFEILKEAVSIFGKGNVTSVLIVGLQPKEDIVTAYREMVDIGVVPTLIPFKPLDNTQMEDSKLADVNEYISLSKELALYMRRQSLQIQCNSGCASCGACSLEINLSEVFK